jgi:hypothetical protein
VACAVQVYFAGGAHRDYVIVYQSAGFHRPGGWWALSRKRGPLRGELDLRDPAQARQLAEALAETDIEALAGARRTT